MMTFNTGDNVRLIIRDNRVSRDGGVTWTNEPAAPFNTTLIAPTTCEHTVTVCVECVDSWSADYEVTITATRAHYADMVDESDDAHDEARD
jgi:hypothetical protein